MAYFLNIIVPFNKYIQQILKKDLNLLQLLLHSKIQ